MQLGSSGSGEFDDLLADSGLTRAEVGPEVDFFPEQDETQAGDLARKGDEGWLFLAVLLDLFSRRVVGFAMGPRITGALAAQALRMALARRSPAPGLLHHSDRGCQYAALDYQLLLRDHGLVSSMSRTGNCLDNAVAESFFSTLKIELVHRCDWTSRSEAHDAVFAYIEGFYNRHRLHSALGYRSPVEYEEIMRAA